MQETSVERKLKLCWLKSFYGEMLTEKERLAAEYYLDEDLSLAQIAAEMNISRQGVHDTLNRAFTKLEEFEEKLGLAQRFERSRKALQNVDQAIRQIKPAAEDKVKYEKVLRMIEDLIRAEEQ